MQPVSPAATRYDAATIAFHWLTALLVVGQWVGAQVIDWFPPGPLRVDARSVHIVAGVLLAALLLARVGWRATRGRRLPLADGPALSVVAKGTYWALYGLLATMVALGFLLTWARGAAFLTSSPSPASDWRTMTRQISCRTGTMPSAS